VNVRRVAARRDRERSKFSSPVVMSNEHQRTPPHRSAPSTAASPARDANTGPCSAQPLDSASIVWGMVDRAPGCAVEPVTARDPEVRALLEALTAELGSAGYSSDQTFGYSAEQLEQNQVHLVAARVGDLFVGVAGLEVQGEGVGELKRFFVQPEHRGTGVADALMAALLDHARARRVRLLRLETGDKQEAAQAFYLRHGFLQVPRFAPYEASETSVCMQRRL
jgi:putative acetyltransferase